MHCKLIAKRILETIIIVTLLSGCTAYYEVPIRTEEVPEEQKASEVKLVPGFNVKILLYSGDSFQGKIKSVGDTWVEVEKPGNFGIEVKFYEFSAIEKIEVEIASKTSNVLLGPAVFGGYVALLFTAYLVFGDYSDVN